MFWAKTLKEATFCAPLSEPCCEEEPEDELEVEDPFAEEEEPLPLLLLEEEEEPWLEDELEGVFPVLLLPEVAAVIAVVTTTSGMKTYLKKLPHIG